MLWKLSTKMRRQYEERSSLKAHYNVTMLWYLRAFRSHNMKTRLLCNDAVSEITFRDEKQLSSPSLMKSGKLDISQKTKGNFIQSAAENKQTPLSRCSSRERVLY